MSLQFKLFGGVAAAGFEDSINTAIADGWAPVGGPFFANGSYTQAMSRERKSAAVGVRKGAAPTEESIKALIFEIHGMEQGRADEASKRGITAAELDATGYHPNAAEIAAKAAILDDQQEWLRDVNYEKGQEAKKAAKDAAEHPEKYPSTADRAAVTAASKDMTEEGKTRFSAEYEKQRAAGKDHATALKAASDSMLKPGPTPKEVEAASQAKAAQDAKAARDAESRAGR